MNGYEKQALEYAREKNYQGDNLIHTGGGIVLVENIGGIYSARMVETEIKVVNEVTCYRLFVNGADCGTYPTRRHAWTRAKDLILDFKLK